ncbi:MAG: hypothetical protein K8U57_40075 [Planctomycetes bacterium]|nr:hypothetical protein [Planctomycetota bacterium]
MFRMLCVLVFISMVVGCGSEPEPTGPKETLTEKEKQQVQDLNKQRQEEWKSTPVQKK